MIIITDYYHVPTHNLLGNKLYLFVYRYKSFDDFSDNIYHIEHLSTSADSPEQALDHFFALCKVHGYIAVQILTFDEICTHIETEGIQEFEVAWHE